MASRLPAIPKFIFLVFEPITLLAGWGTATFDPAGFISDQIAGQEAAVSDHARLLALQLGNCYGLMFLLGLVVLYANSELKVIRGYLLALSVTDVTHVAVCYHVLGVERFAAVHQWNSTMWGNIAMPTALFLLRVVYFLGAFGPDKPASPEKKLN